MKSTPRVTIDTNCINAKGRVQALNELEELERLGSITLTTTRVLLEELQEDLTAFGEARRLKARAMPSGTSGFVLGRSRLSGADVLGGPNAYGHVEQITQIIRPGCSWDDLDGNTHRDVMHLAIHHANGWDLFVTMDKGILDHAEQLASDMGLFVVSPEEALAWLIRSPSGAAV